jgi:catechol 1,2-dioxygenase
MNKATIETVLATIQRSDGRPANARAKTIVDRIVADLFHAIDDLDITPDEFWTAASYLTRAGQSNEFGLIAAGLGFEHYFDLRLDDAEAAAGIAPGGTPRTIEGPLYVAGAPVAQGEARLDDGRDEGELLFMDGQVRDVRGRAVPGAIVEVWHADSLGNYSHFDKSQSAFNLRRTIETDGQGRYAFRSIMPSGYGCPPDGATQALLDLLGRHGRRPAHIHFFVHAPGHRHLTTQINIDGDEYLHDDFAFATRDGLVPAVTRHVGAEAMLARGVNRPFAAISFDFVLVPEAAGAPADTVQRERVAVG